MLIGLSFCPISNSSTALACFCAEHKTLPKLLAHYFVRHCSAPSLYSKVQFSPRFASSLYCIQLEIVCLVVCISHYLSSFVVSFLEDGFLISRFSPSTSTHM